VLVIDIEDPVVWFAVKAVLVPPSPLLTFSVNMPLPIFEVNAMVPVAAGIVRVVVPAAAVALRTVVPEVDPLKVAPAPPIIGVTSEGLVLNTNFPDPVSLVITVASSAEVVAANAFSLSVNTAVLPPRRVTLASGRVTILFAVRAEPEVVIVIFLELVPTVAAARTIPSLIPSTAPTEVFPKTLFAYTLFHAAIDEPRLKAGVVGIISDPTPALVPELSTRDSITVR